MLVVLLATGTVGFLTARLASPHAGPAAEAKPGGEERPAALPADDKPLVLSELDRKLEHYLKLIKPGSGEWKFATVPWVPTVWEARKKAAEEGKPLFVWYMAGEPLGQC
jgi:hypothetical protein